jgi:hypothetical protein
MPLEIQRIECSGIEHGIESGQVRLREGNVNEGEYRAKARCEEQGISRHLEARTCCVQEVET